MSLALPCDLGGANTTERGLTAARCPDSVTGLGTSLTSGSMERLGLGEMVPPNPLICCRTRVLIHRRAFLF